jgi:HD superfamily phosphohydrolase YqeK
MQNKHYLRPLRADDRGRSPFGYVFTNHWQWWHGEFIRGIIGVIMNFTIDSIISLLKKRISEKRFSHSMGVANCAKELAKTFNYDESKAYLAGILHDCSTQYSGEEMIYLAEKIGLELKPGECENPVSSLHAILGSYVVKHEYGIDDEEIL